MQNHVSLSAGLLRQMPSNQTPWHRRSSGNDLGQGPSNGTQGFEGALSWSMFLVALAGLFEIMSEGFRMACGAKIRQSVDGGRRRADFRMIYGT